MATSYAYDTDQGRRARLASIGARLTLTRADRGGDIVMQSARYPRYEGTYEPGTFLWIYLCLGGGGRLVRMSGAQSLDGQLLPGRVGIGAPYDGGEGQWQAMELLALGISERRLRRLVTELPDPHIDIGAVASRFHDDALLGATLQAMWENAERHGLSTAFFDHALAVLVHRIGERSRRTASAHAPRLSHRQMDMVVGFIEANLAKDLSVSDLASLVGFSPFHFSRCFRATTGLPPYAFMTRARLARAAILLSQSEIAVGEIAASVGYESASQFSAAFRRWKSVAPLAYRRTTRS